MCAGDGGPPGAKWVTATARVRAGDGDPAPYPADGDSPRTRVTSTRPTYAADGGGP
ncbi:hypothetical protein GCM10010448_15000 [Streptomyces glomeratus]|uniref:Uncharacterized protein n=1 Tax=Streptomyces glomeratus TaxID=284452 RepID=A0ABP6LBD2_9ACTN